MENNKSRNVSCKFCNRTISESYYDHTCDLCWEAIRALSRSTEQQVRKLLKSAGKDHLLITDKPMVVRNGRKKGEPNGL